MWVEGTHRGGEEALESPMVVFFNSLFCAVSRHEATRIAARSSVFDSLLGCDLFEMRNDKEDLRRRILMSEYLRTAIVEAVRSRDPTAGLSHNIPSGRRDLALDFVSGEIHERHITLSQ